MFRRRTAFVTIALVLAGCSGLKDALTNHVNTAATAGTRELPAARLAELMNAAQMPPRKELASAVASLWVNYQLLAQAAARSDTLAGDALADEAMWAQVAQRRLQKLEEAIAATAHVEVSPAELETAYNSGKVLVARHILISAARNSLTAKQIDSARRVAENVRRQVTPANFVAMVKRYSGDPGSAASGGEYVWPSVQIPAMVPEFEQGARALKPGEISDPIQTDFGFHIILRESYADAKSRFDTAYTSHAKQEAEQAWITALEDKANVKVDEDAPRIVKAIVEDLDVYRDNRTVLATAKGVDLRAARVANWIAAFPPQVQIRQQLQQAPDSVMPRFVKNLMRNELLLRAADSAKIELAPDELAQIRESFRGSVRNTMGALGILPSQLADSAKTASDRSALAASRVDAYLGHLVRNEAQFVDISEPVALALRSKYHGSVNDAGLDKAATLAATLKSGADAAAAATMPPTEVPMPGAAAPATTPGTKKP